MSLIERLEQEMKAALKEKEKTKLSVIRMARAEIKKEEIAQKRTLTEAEVLQVIGRELKQRKEALEGYQKAGRKEQVAQQEEEIAILKTYLPEQLSEEELVEIVQQVIAEIGAVTKSDMGKVMRGVMPRVQGKADGKKVNQIVQQYLK